MSEKTAIFHPGQVVMTPGAMQALKPAGHLPSEFLNRHVVGN